MREIVLDTETTGLDPNSGHRIVEIGCVELINHVATGNTFHVYINPEREMPAEAFAVHGLSNEFLADKPVFSEVVGDFLAFVAKDQMIIHNADFDLKFLNWELQNLGFPPLPRSQATDTVAMARKRFPGAQANLDALCRRFGIDNSNRDLHGALLDSELLAEVYLELLGGRQPDLALAGGPSKSGGLQTVAKVERVARPPRPHAPTPEEAEAHAAFISKSVKDAIWTGGNKG